MDQGRDFEGTKVAAEDNRMLTAPFSKEKVKQAIESCESSKSLGPDGFNFNFFKTFWESYREDILRFFWDFYQHGRLVKGLNNSFVVFIPKKEEAKELHDFRPISLIGGVYKILAKVLANRLRRVLDKIISENQ